MSSASIKKIIPCDKKKLIKMVLDIEKYPEFVPWCLDSKINSKKDTGDYTEINADLKVGKKFINETYRSLILYSKKNDNIIVTNINGPLKYLKNEWKFKKINSGTQLEFKIDFELKNSFLNLMMKSSFKLGLNRNTDALVLRAEKLVQ